MDMKKLLTLSLLGMLLLVSGGSAAWERLWDEKVDSVVLNSRISSLEDPSYTVRVFAVQSESGDIYRYAEATGEWTKVGNPGKKFVASGGVDSRVYGLDPAGMGVYEFSGTPMEWTQVGGPAGDIYAGGAELYATNPEDDWAIYKYTGNPWEWTLIGEFPVGGGEIVDYAAAGAGYRRGPAGLVETFYPTLYLLEDRASQSKGYTVGVVRKYTGTGLDPIDWEVLPAGDLDFSAIHGDGFNTGAIYAQDYHSRDIYLWSEDDDSWEKASGPAKILLADQYKESSTVHNLLYRLEEDGELWVSDDNEGSWTKIDTSGWRNPLKAIYAAGGELYALSEAGYVFRYVP
jgi:hypothetical protein